MISSYTIGIAGGSGSGKSTFAQKLRSEFSESVAIVSCDNYYLSRDDLLFEERKKLNFDAPDAFEFELMIEHINALRRGETIFSPVYDFSLHTRSDSVVKIESKPIIIIDGILIFTEKRLREIMDMKIYVETDADERILRRVKRDTVERGRDIDNIIEQYLSTVKPMHNKYVEPTKAYADIIINGGMNEVAFDIVKTKIERFLKEER